jgi:oligopeptide transport system substrate-binding protein
MRKPVALALAAILALGALAGCAGKQQPKGPAEKVIRYNAGADFRTLDPQLISDTTSSSAAYNLFDGLVRMSEKGNLPAMAEKWEISENGTKYTFHLRDGLKWSNGDPITAEDFVYAWTRGLDPKVGSEYAYQLYYIKGGEEFNKVDPKDTAKYEAAKKALGVRAVDAKTLEVTLTTPTPYFLDLTASPTYFPVNRKVVEANTNWATKPETLVSNGPFKLQSWEPKKQAVFVKNPNYWNAANVKVDKLVFLMIEDEATALQLFESGQLDYDDYLPQAELARLKKENKIQFAPIYATYYYEFNTTKPPFNDPRVRRALALALDREAIVNNVAKGGQKPAYGYVPYGSKDETGQDFRETAGSLFSMNVDEAKRLLAEAGYPNGQGFPEVNLLYNTSQTHKAVAEAVIEMWRKNLGITSIKATNMEFKVLLDVRGKGDFAIARAGWNGDYLDPMTFLEMWTTGHGQNNAKWSNKQYDALIAKAKATDDQKVRMPALREAEKILMNEMAILPVYFSSQPVATSPKLTGVYRNAIGVIDFSAAEIK